jgi:hypothetical protein
MTVGCPGELSLGTGRLMVTMTEIIFYTICGIDIKEISRKALVGSVHG